LHGGSGEGLVFHNRAQLVACGACGIAWDILARDDGKLMKVEVIGGQCRIEIGFPFHLGGTGNFPCVEARITREEGVANHAVKRLPVVHLVAVRAGIVVHVRAQTPRLAVEFEDGFRDGGTGFSGTAKKLRADKNRARQFLTTERRRDVGGTFIRSW